MRAAPELLSLENLCEGKQGCFLLPCSCSVTVCNLTHLPVPEPGGARCLGARVGF